MTTPDDQDIFRAARILIDQHGDEAHVYAAMRVDELLERGDLDGQAVWKRIMRAIDELLAKERPTGASVH